MKKIQGEKYFIDHWMKVSWKNLNLMLKQTDISLSKFSSEFYRHLWKYMRYSSCHWDSLDGLRFPLLPSLEFSLFSLKGHKKVHVVIFILEGMSGGTRADTQSWYSVPILSFAISQCCHNYGPDTYWTVLSSGNDFWICFFQILLE